MKILFKYIRPYRPLVLLAFVLAAINQTFSLFDPMIFGKLIDQFANHAKTNPDGSFRSESEFIKGVESMLVGSIVRQEAVARETRDVGVGRGRGKLSARDLMTEVERVLSRSNSGMTLLERL